jgi:hypothetical protein
MDPIQLDTTQAATNTIAYVATDQDGRAATSTRTVIVEPDSADDSVESPQGSPTGFIIQAANDNQASTTGTNDNTPPLDTSTTTATSTP